MKLLPKAKPVRIRIFSGGEYHSSLDSLKSNFNSNYDFESLLELYKDKTLQRWLKQIGADKEVAELDFIEVEDISKVPIEECEKILSILTSNVSDVAYKIAKKITNKELVNRLLEISCRGGNLDVKYEFVSNMEKEDFAKSVQKYKEMAQAGHSKSILKLIEFYINGKITKSRELIKLLEESKIENNTDYTYILKVLGEIEDYEPNKEQILRVCKKLDIYSDLYIDLLSEENIKSIGNNSEENKKSIGNKIVYAPFQGIITKINVVEGQTVSSGQELMVFGNYRLQKRILSEINGTILRIHASHVFNIKKGEILLELKPITSNNLDDESIFKRSSLYLNRYNITLPENLQYKGKDAILKWISEIGIKIYENEKRFFLIPTKKSINILRYAARHGSVDAKNFLRDNKEIINKIN